MRARPPGRRGAASSPWRLLSAQILANPHARSPRPGRSPPPSGGPATTSAAASLREMGIQTQISNPRCQNSRSATRHAATPTKTSHTHPRHTTTDGHEPQAPPRGQPHERNHTNSAPAAAAAALKRRRQQRPRARPRPTGARRGADAALRQEAARSRPSRKLFEMVSNHPDILRWNDAARELVIATGTG